MSERVLHGQNPVQGAGEDPLYHFTRVFASFLQQCFAGFEKGHNRWTEDELSSEIIITAEAPVEKETVEKRPAIVLAMGPSGSANIAIDQLLRKDDITTARRLHTDLVSSTMSVNCISSDPLFARRIAWQSHRFIRAFKRSLMRSGMHRVGEEMQIGSPSPPGALVAPEVTNEVSLVTLSVPFYFQDWWAVEPVDKNLLKRVDFALTSELNYPAGGSINPPAMNGKPLKYTERRSLDSSLRVSSLIRPKPRT